MEYSEVADPMNDGDKKYQKRARRALPLLVRQASAGSTIVYSDLADLLDMPNPRNLNYVLGSVGQTLHNLAKEWEEKIPPIQCIVVNKQDGLPGEGIGWLVSDKDAFSKLPTREQRKIVDHAVSEVSAYPKWDKVLNALGLQPVEDDLSDVVESSTHARSREAEGEDHLQLKEYVARHPKVVGLPLSAGPGDIEVVLPSGDQVDVMFFWDDTYHAVEVKSHRSDDGDLTRGLFQCVKYEAVLRAQLAVEDSKCDATAVLVVGRPLPPGIDRARQLLDIDVVLEDDIPELDT